MLTIRLPHCLRQNHAGQSGEFFRSVFQDMSAVYRLNHCQPLSMIAICVSSKLVFDLVRLKICEPSAFQNSVFRHSRIPHQIASCLHITHIYKQSPHINHSISHNGQRKVVRHIILIGMPKKVSIAWLNVSKAPESTCMGGTDFVYAGSSTAKDGAAAKIPPFHFFFKG